MSAAPSEARRAGARATAVRAGRLVRGDLGAAVAAGAIALVAAAWVLELWNAPLGVPWFANGDVGITQLTTRSTIEDGWPLGAGRLGFPYGQDARDFSVLNGDWLQWAFVWVLGRAGNVFSVINAYFLLSFGLIAMTAFAALRGLGVSRGVSLALGVLFSLAPYHFLRNESHLMLSSYFAVPGGAYLVLCAFMGHPLFDRPRGRRTAGTLAACLLLILAGFVYYLVFTVLLLGVAIVARAAATRSLRDQRSSMLTAAFLVGGLLLVQMPTLVHWATDGTNALVAARSPAESEIYALKPLQLVLPLADHRLPVLRGPGEEYGRLSVLKSEGSSPTLGLVGAVGLLWLVVVALAALAGGRIGDPRERAAAAAATAAAALGAVGGLGTAISFLLTPSVRGWNRISIFIAFFALVGAGVALDRLLARRVPAHRRRLAVPLVLAALVVVGTLDQTTKAMAPDYTGAKAAFTSDARFVRSIEQQMPPGAPILQLPYVPFPENPPVNGMSDYALARGYVHSARLRWSYGAVKGRDEDWLGRTEGLPLARLLDVATATGFMGLWVDRTGYVDGNLEANLVSALGPPALQSENGNLAFWDLRDRAATQLGAIGGSGVAALREAADRPAVSLEYGDGFYERESDAESEWRWTDRTASLDLHNDEEAAQPVVFETELDRFGADADVELRFPDGTVRSTTTGGTPTTVSTRFMAPPGDSRIEVRTDGRRVVGVPEDDRPLYVRFEDTVLVNALLCPAAGLTECTRGDHPQDP